MMAMHRGEQNTDIRTIVEAHRKAGRFHVEKRGFSLHRITVCVTLSTTSKQWRLDMLRILDTAVTLTFYTIIAVAAVLVFGAFF